MSYSWRSLSEKNKSCEWSNWSLPLPPITTFHLLSYHPIPTLYSNTPSSVSILGSRKSREVAKKNRAKTMQREMLAATIKPKWECLNREEEEAEEEGV